MRIRMLMLMRMPMRHRARDQGAMSCVDNTNERMTLRHYNVPEHSDWRLAAYQNTQDYLKRHAPHTSISIKAKFGEGVTLKTTTRLS